MWLGPSLCYFRRGVSSVAERVAEAAPGNTPVIRIPGSSKSDAEWRMFDELVARHAEATGRPRLSALWDFIHLAALSIEATWPPSEIDAARATYFFMEYVPASLRCKGCADHYEAHIAPLVGANKRIGAADIFAWSVDLHNAVNLRLNRAAWAEATARRVYAVHLERYAARR
jgi:hypothetical protein